MSVLSAQSIRKAKIITPFVERTVHNGMTYGLGPASYDVRIAQDLVLERGGFAIASTIERFEMPYDIMGFPKNKSTWARRGVDTSFNTLLDPGWDGYLTVELINHGHATVIIRKGDAIAQIVFMWLDAETELPYIGQKYSNQPNKPVEALVF